MNFQNFIIPIKHKDKINLLPSKIDYGCVLSKQYLTNIVKIYDFNYNSNELKINYKKLNTTSSVISHSFYKNFNFTGIYLYDSFNKIKIEEKNTTLILDYKFSKYILNMEEDDLNSITQLNIEINRMFEHCYLHDVEILKKINKYFYIIHMQADNSLPFYINNIPASFKLTLLNKNLFVDKKVYKESAAYPIKSIDYTKKENVFFKLNWWKSKNMKINQI